MKKISFFLWIISLELLVCTSLQAKENNVVNVWDFGDQTSQQVTLPGQQQMQTALKKNSFKKFR